MSRPPRRRPTASSAHRYPRTARLGELLREVIAEELERIGDERLELVGITSIDVDAELNRAIVYYDAFYGEAADEATLDALSQHRVRLQGAIARQVRARKTPILDFRPDNVLRSAERIERVLRDNPVPERDYGLPAPDESNPRAGGGEEDDVAAEDDVAHEDDIDEDHIDEAVDQAAGDGEA